MTLTEQFWPKLQLCSVYSAAAILNKWATAHWWASQHHLLGHGGSGYLFIFL